MMIVSVDALARENVADRLVVASIPDTEAHKAKATEFVDWLNSLGHGDTFSGRWYTIKPNDYRLSRGMADLV